jgi:hypothetical protein
MVVDHTEADTSILVAAPQLTGAFEREPDHEQTSALPSGGDP